jgi:hypothetical protein
MDSSESANRETYYRRAEFLHTILIMRKLLIPLVGLAFICTGRATVDDGQKIEGLPVTVVSSGRSYKVFEQYPWEGHSSNYGPKGNRLNSGYGVGVGKNIRRSLQVRHGDWIHMPDIGWRQINESSSKSDGIEFFATYRDQYKGKHPRMAIDKVVFALPSQPPGPRPFGCMEPTPTRLFNPTPSF